MALLLFNVGVELGQLVFIGAVLVVIRLLRIGEVSWPMWAKQLPAYGIGTVAVYWVLERTVGFWG